MTKIKTTKRENFLTNLENLENGYLTTEENKIYQALVKLMHKNAKVRPARLNLVGETLEKEIENENVNAEAGLLDIINHIKGESLKNVNVNSGADKLNLLYGYSFEFKCFMYALCKRGIIYSVSNMISPFRLIEIIFNIHFETNGLLEKAYEERGSLYDKIFLMIFGKK